jgi:hypothetical protein
LLAVVSYATMLGILPMILSSKVSEHPVAKVRSRPWLIALAIVPLVGTALLAARLIWEQTVWTWKLGPQMVGFSLVHGPEAVLLLAPVLLAGWVFLAIVLFILDLVKKRGIHRPTRVLFGLALLLFGLLALPSRFWQRLFIRQMAASQRAGDLLAYAAYADDFGTIQAMLSHGVSINATDHAQRRTVLHAAAFAGDLRTLKFLVSNGANVNALDRSGDSPAELAASQGHQECALFLQAHGGVRIKGDEAQHEKAIHDQVHDDIEQMNNPRP